MDTVERASAGAKRRRAPWPAGTRSSPTCARKCPKCKNKGLAYKREGGRPCSLYTNAQIAKLGGPRQALKSAIAVYSPGLTMFTGIEMDFR